jgi:hypothetical protein
MKLRASSDIAWAIFLMLIRFLQEGHSTVVFSVAAHRCREVFNPPESVTLWQLPETVEEEFESHWERCLDQAGQWRPFFQELEKLKQDDLKIALQSFDLVTSEELELFSRLRRSAEGRAVPLPTPFTGANA